MHAYESISMRVAPQIQSFFFLNPNSRCSIRPVAESAAEAKYSLNMCRHLSRSEAREIQFIVVFLFHHSCIRPIYIMATIFIACRLWVSGYVPSSGNFF